MSAWYSGKFEIENSDKPTANNYANNYINIQDPVSSPITIGKYSHVVICEKTVFPIFMDKK